MKINKEFIFKNLTAVLAVISIAAMFLQFISVKATATASSGGFSASAGGGDTVLDGFSMVTSGGLFGILLDICIVVIILSSYLPQLKQYRKFVLAGSAVVGIICLIIVPGNIASEIASVGGNYGGASVKVDSEITPQIGYWIILLCYIAILAVAVIQFFNLKGNKVFDMVNSDNEAGGEGAQLGFNSEKLKEMTQNAVSGISGAASGIKDKISGSSSSGGSSGEAPKKAVQKGDPQEIMKQIKELHEMKEAGVLTEEEFAAKKQEFLDKM